VTSDLILIFLNDRPVHIGAGSTLADVLRESAPDLLAALDGGTAVATDGRGVPVDRNAAAAPGAIFRVHRSARTGTADA